MCQIRGERLSPVSLPGLQMTLWHGDKHRHLHVLYVIVVITIDDSNGQGLLSIIMLRILLFNCAW